MRIGYLRGDGGEDEILKAVASLESAGCARVTIDSRSRRQPGVNPAFSALVARLQPEDTLVVPGLDHLAHTLGQLLERLDAVLARGIALETLSGELDAGHPGLGRTVRALQTFAIRNRALHAAPGEHGLRPHPGRPRRLPADEVAWARQQLAGGQRSVSEIAHELGVSRATLYRSLRQQAGGGIAHEAGSGLATHAPSFKDQMG